MGASKSQRIKKIEKTMTYEYHVIWHEFCFLFKSSFTIIERRCPEEHNSQFENMGQVSIKS
jgi:hypothetical protein